MCIRDRVYTGTHDNNTTRGWFEELQPDQRQIVWRSLNRPGCESGDATPALLHLAWSSAAALALAPLQDLLNLGSDARMNVPGTAEGNWTWRFEWEQLTPAIEKKLSELTVTYERKSANHLNREDMATKSQETQKVWG